MSRKFNLNDSIKNRKSLPISNIDLDKLLHSVQKKDTELVRVNFEIEKELRQKLKSKASAEGKQIKEVLIGLIKVYLEIE